MLLEVESRDDGAGGLDRRSVARLLEPNIVLERSQEVLNLIYARYKLLCRHIKLIIPPEIEQDFFKVVVDELIGIGSPESRPNDDQRKMERCHT